MGRPINIHDSVSLLPGIGPQYEKRLKKLAIQTIADLLYHFPSRHIDYSLFSPLKQVQPGETVTVRGKIKRLTNRYLRSGKTLQQALIEDQTGSLIASWFNQTYLLNILHEGETISLSGIAKIFAGHLTMTAPEWEKGPFSLHTGRLVPVYPLTQGLSSKWLRAKIKVALALSKGKIKEFLPVGLLVKENLINEYEALKKIHFPENKIALKRARERLSFDEIFLLQLAAAVRRNIWKKKKIAFPIAWQEKEITAFRENLPFSLTKAQEKAIQEILNDLKRPLPMNRLLEGDVGSGKTVVAAFAAYAVAQAGKKVFFMAPTQILAQQHYQTFRSLLPGHLSIDLLLGGKRPASLTGKIIIGTQALLFQDRLPSDLALVIIDEQHRFGVRQRSQLIQKNPTPHLLTMTATPIPRTVALTLYGDLDISLLDEMPQGRKKTITRIFLPAQRKAAYQFLAQQIKKTSCQAYIVCPLIEESSKERLQNIRAAKNEYERLKKEFPQLQFALLHGQLDQEKKENIMKKFQSQKIDVLVATPVVEVGMDFPRATIILIEGAERFGLAQLHQLRGRVGRSKEQSYCLLLPSQKAGEEAIRRLYLCQKENNGLRLAQIDLQQRGPGEIYGFSQHGFPKMKIARLNDINLIKRAQKEARYFASRLDQFPSLKKKLKKYTIKPVAPN